MQESEEADRKHLPELLVPGPPGILERLEERLFQLASESDALLRDQWRQEQPVLVVNGGEERQIAMASNGQRACPDEGVLKAATHPMNMADH